ncbi:hypothetical cytosolic protein [Syntrophus aciditrophicus SB]|uniref:Hypothetical cytosolic protein n=1 Tax=Syntrophus aciditrophicus (strain SB) TaxID=56780 RepID=Q2LW19_SYNAS|nr:hypothetical cytosolic protein [Syntrophus aciditrophicus SB]
MRSCQRTPEEKEKRLEGQDFWHFQNRSSLSTDYQHRSQPVSERISPIFGTASL